ncbi:basic proline-rich protein-like [Sapajus apella]|uniref:Basic proline-rich protein-like n=1 Tax=Sapajus apella TaxID=9515 RepID=A0A6J3GF23_SAPAP|nr:basic proline-rich protein-like [Sapajus apella]
MSAPLRASLPPHPCPVPPASAPSGPCPPPGRTDVPEARRGGSEGASVLQGEENQVLRSECAPSALPPRLPAPEVGSRAGASGLGPAAASARCSLGPAAASAPLQPRPCPPARRPCGGLSEGNAARPCPCSSGSETERKWAKVGLQECPPAPPDKAPLPRSENHAPGESRRPKKVYNHWAGGFHDGVETTRVAHTSTRTAEPTWKHHGIRFRQMPSEKSTPERKNLRKGIQKESPPLCKIGKCTQSPHSRECHRTPRNGRLQPASSSLFSSSPPFFTRIGDS